MLAEIVISFLVSLDLILFARGYRACVAIQSRLRLDAQSFYEECSLESRRERAKPVRRPRYDPGFRRRNGFLNRREINLCFRNPNAGSFPRFTQPLNMLATNPRESDNVTAIVARGEVRAPAQSDE
jgi:hypothetical protein